MFFLYKQKTAYELRISDWSSDVCSSELIDGVDAAHKLTILASLALGTELDFDAVAITGIRHVIAADIAGAAALGYRIRLVGMAENGSSEERRAGQECVSTCTFRWSLDHYNRKTTLR